MKVQNYLLQTPFETLENLQEVIFSNPLGENINIALVEGSYKFCHFSGLHFTMSLWDFKSNPIWKNHPSWLPCTQCNFTTCWPAASTYCVHKDLPIPMLRENSSHCPSTRRGNTCINLPFITSRNLAIDSTDIFQWYNNFCRKA